MLFDMSRSVKHTKSSCSDSESDVSMPELGSVPVTLESLGLSRSQLAAVRILLDTAKPKKIRKTPAVPRKTPDGLVGCRQGIMMIMGVLRNSSAFSGQSDFLQAIYNLLGAEDDGKGPMKIATPILQHFAKSEIIYNVWQEISKKRSEDGFKRGEDRDFFIQKSGIFITSCIHLLLGTKGTGKLMPNEKPISFWASQDFDACSKTFQALINSADPAGAEMQCSHTTLKGTPCQKPGKHSHDEKYFCTQHFKIVTA